MANAQTPHSKQLRRATAAEWAKHNKTAVVITASINNHAEWLAIEAFRAEREKSDKSAGKVFLEWARAAGKVTENEGQ